MSYSLQLRGGDLAPSGSQMALVEGPNKMVQDLRCALLEPRATDPLHPDFGSTLNGGVDELGNPNPGVIGALNNDVQAVSVESEIRRVITAYMVAQLAKLTEENNTYGGQNTFAAGEIITDIADVQISRLQDVMVVVVTLVTDTGQQIQLTRPIANG